MPTPATAARFMAREAEDDQVINHLLLIPARRRANKRAPSTCACKAHRK